MLDLNYPFINGVRHYHQEWQHGTLVRYVFFVMVRVRYAGTLYELKTPDFSHIAPVFGMQRQKTAEADAKYVN